MSNAILTWYSMLSLLTAWLVVAGLAGRAACGEEKEPPDAGRSQVTSERKSIAPKGVITVSQALSSALQNNPDLQSVSAEVKAQEARALQAGLLPNPEFGIEAENFGGSGDVNGFDATETTIQLSQRFELGEKRAKRKQAAFLGRDVAQTDYEARRADVLHGGAKGVCGGAVCPGACLPDKKARHHCGAGPPDPLTSPD